MSDTSLHNNSNVLCEKLKDGNNQAFKQLFEEMYPALCHFATNYLKNDDEAADIVQECFIVYWNRRKDFDNIYKLRSFLYISVRNSCLNILRKEKKQHLYAQDAFEEDYFKDNLIEEEAIRMFHQAVKQLSGQSQKVILLSLEGMNNEEIATKMNISINTVHMFKKIAYKKLRDLLREYYYLTFIFLN